MKKDHFEYFCSILIRIAIIYLTFIKSGRLGQLVRGIAYPTFFSCAIFKEIDLYLV